MMNDVINIVFATDNNYAQHCTVAMASILCNTNTPTNIHFYIIDDEIEESVKEKVIKSILNLGGNIDFVRVENEALKNGFVSGNLTRTAYFRLDIANILPANVDKTIYLDCDLIVLEDIACLWSLDMQGKPVGATPDLGILSSKGKMADKEKEFNWKTSYGYFNSGVMLLDLNQWRINDYAGKVLKLIKAKKYRHHDQDALNELFMRNWIKLPLKWNVIPPVYNMPFRVLQNNVLRNMAIEALKYPAIVHYAGGYKPWEYAVYEGFNTNYYKYLAKTEFSNVDMPQPNLKKSGHSITRQLWRLKWGKLVVKILTR